MTNLTVIILTKDEHLHIARCLEKLRPLEPQQVFVVDCFSTDGTQDIARSLGATVIEHKWPGNQATQFNWALDNLPITSEWILRLDADEYLYPETCKEVTQLLPTLSPDVTSLSLSRARFFDGKKIRFGNPEVELVRLFRKDAGRSSHSEMDEHIVTSYGHNIKLSGKFADDSRIPFTQWKSKHRDYAQREARMALSGGANANKRLYYRLPPYLRALAYFSYRYFLRLGFLDGIAGWRWHFWQGLWYRWLVDKTIAEMKRQKNFRQD